MEWPNTLFIFHRTGGGNYDQEIRNLQGEKVVPKYSVENSRVYRGLTVNPQKTDLTQD